MSKLKEFVVSHKGMVIASCVLLVLIIGLSVGIPCGIAFSKRTGVPGNYAYNKEADFDVAKDGYVLTAADGREFKLLNIADLQMSENYSIFKNNANYNYIKELVQEQKPDLLTFTGDNVWLSNTKGSIKRFIKNIDSLGVPWAPVFGNHDSENEVDKNWMIDQFLMAENCIFNYGDNASRDKDLAKGPKNISGVGNYVINIVNSQKQIIHTLFMMDSHANNSDQNPDAFKKPEQGTSVEGLDGWFANEGYLFAPGKESAEIVGVGSEYDYIKQDQIDWYEWAVKGIAKINGGKVVQSSAFFHIPLPEFNIAYALYKKTLPTNYNGRDVVGADKNFGLNRENPCSPYYNSGFFDKMCELGSTKNVVVGHDHVNDSSVVYKGIRLTYALKTGNGCYWDNSGDVSGGTMITIAANGDTTTQHKYKRLK